jgi:hypothetical protein
LTPLSQNEKSPSFLQRFLYPKQSKPKKFDPSFAKRKKPFFSSALFVPEAEQTKKV